MSELNFENNNADSESVAPEQLSTTEIFSFLKRYHNDLYPGDQSEINTVCEGVYYETIVALEKLHHCLVIVADFIGHAKVDWDEACTQKNSSKKKKIINFYNGLIVNIKLMQFADKNYDFSPRVKAFIHFLDSEPECLFRLNVQTTSWTSENFPHEDIFQYIEKFKSFIEERKRIYQDKGSSNNGESHAKEIQIAISSAKRITQFMFLFKFDVMKFTDDDLTDLISKEDLDPDRTYLTRIQKMQCLVDWFSCQIFGEGLPRLCQITKAELNIKKHIKLQVGLILDSSNRKFNSDEVARSLKLEIRNVLDKSWLRSFVTMEIVQIDQIFDYLGVGVLREIKLPNKKKIALMLKWYIGIFWGVNKIIRPVNLEVESGYYESNVLLDINSRYVEKLKRNDQSKRKLVNSKRELSERKEDVFSTIWNMNKLLKQVPGHFGFIHMFYAGLEYSENLTKEEIQMLQRLSLFVAYLNENNLDGLSERLTISKNQKHWPAVVQMFLSFLYTPLDCLLELKRWINVDLLIIHKKLYQHPKVSSILRNTISSELMHEIVDIVTDLQKVVRKSEWFQHIMHDVKLVRKNSRLGQNYLNNSFKQNAMVLHFQVDNRDSKLDLKDLKQVFTQFIKRVGRAPKRIGANLDSYIGYFVFDKKNYSIDFTTIFYTRNDAPGSVLLAMKNEWKNFISDYIKGLSDKMLKDACMHLKLEMIPTLWSQNSGVTFLVINKGDKIINSVKKDIVTFYTAYEYFNGYKNTNIEADKRPELFLRGRNRRPALKKSSVNEGTNKKTEELNTGHPIDSNLSIEVAEPQNGGNTKEISNLIDSVNEKPLFENDSGDDAVGSIEEVIVSSKIAQMPTLTTKSRVSFPKVIKSN